MKSILALVALSIFSFSVLAQPIPDSVVTKENCNNLAGSSSYMNNVYKACGIGGYVFMKDYSEELRPKCHVKFGDDEMNVSEAKGLDFAKFMTRPDNLQKLCDPIRANMKKILGDAEFEKIQTN